MSFVCPETNAPAPSTCYSEIQTGLPPKGKVECDQTGGFCPKYGWLRSGRSEGGDQGVATESIEVPLVESNDVNSEAPGDSAHWEPGAIPEQTPFKTSQPMLGPVPMSKVSFTEC